MSKNSLVARSHNNIERDNSWVVKTSLINYEKLHREYNWFSFIKSLGIEAPNVIKLENGYKIEFLEGDNLGEVFWDMEETQQTKIIDSYFNFLETMMKKGKPNNSLHMLIIEKVNNRISVLPDWAHKKLIEAIKYYKVHAEVLVNKYKDLYTIMHGDVFFGNTICKDNKIMLIDPRGAENFDGIFGNVFYEIIKLSHSVDAMYDTIIFNTDKKDNTNIKNYFFLLSKKIFNINKKDILLGELGLFISMLPIHSDSIKRQEKLIDVALSIFERIK